MKVSAASWKYEYERMTKLGNMWQDRAERAEKALSYYADHAFWPNGEPGMGALARAVLSEVPAQPQDGRDG